MRHDAEQPGGNNTDGDVRKSPLLQAAETLPTELQTAKGNSSNRPGQGDRQELPNHVPPRHPSRVKFVTTRQVLELRNAHPPAVILDVRIPEDFAVAHIAGSLHACVFLMSFVEDVKRLVPDPETPIVVYGTAVTSLESTEASQRLAWAGYASVFNYAGGLAEWKSDALPTLGDGPLPPQPVVDGPVPVDLHETRIEWTGRNLLNKHTGTVGLKSGELLFKEGWLAGGEFVLDMTALTCSDIADAAMNLLLIQHLKGADFFDVDRFPEGRLSLRKVVPVPEGRPGSPNLQLLGDLTVRGITRELPIVAVGGRTPEGRLAVQAVFAFDRTDFGSAYGSGRFFRNLGKHLVNDLVEIQVRLVA